MKRLDLVGQRFGRLVVKEFAYIKKWSFWKCECTCGNITTVPGKDLKDGHTKSCGCLNLELVIKRNKQPKSEEQKKKISNTLKGRPLAEETKRKLSIANTKHGLYKTKAYKCAMSQKRRAAKLNQTPDNANLTTIQLYYSICAYLNEPCEVPMFHVDHFQPISKGGLHHEDNLQILTAKVNLEKSNKWPLTAEEKIQYGGLKI